MATLYIGIYGRTDKPVFGGGLGNYLRIRVGIDFDKPLRRLATVRLPRHPSALVVEVEFENLPHFCYYCGLLSHTGSHCELRKQGIITEPQYDDLIRAEKKEIWLKEQAALRQNEQQPGCLVGRRYGLLSKQGGAGPSKHQISLLRG